MALCPTNARFIRPALRATSCVFCQFRIVQPVRQYATRNPDQLPKPDQLRRSPQEQRRDIDRRSRHVFLSMMRNEGMLTLGEDEADELISDFLDAEQAKVDPTTNVKRLTEKYKRTVCDITYIAIPLFRIPDVKDPKVNLPPSQNPSIGARLLLACSAAGDSLATLQILAAAYFHREGLPQARDIARQFSATDVKSCEKMMDKLAQAGDTDAMTLKGQFLEKNGQRDQAQLLYEKAVEKCDTKFDPKYPHPMALPRVPPWTALASVLLSSESSEARAKAKVVLEKGALKADDPLAYYQLAALETGQTYNWLKYTSKAAASGHLEAAHNLGHFYMEVNSDPESFHKAPQMRKALSFVSSFKSQSMERLAKEWFEVAAAGGHKGAMLELAELANLEGDEEKMREYLIRVIDAPPLGKAEDWTRVVQEARKRLLILKANGQR